MALNAPYTPNTLIQSTQVSNDLTGLANGSNDTSTNSMSTFRSEAFFDFVASGCAWSGDSYGGTRNASQTSGVVYITGVRLAVASVSARNFTASKDTYIDVNGSGVQVYTEATNNAASPALTAGSIRIGIIVTGATTIAAAGSVNQGQESKVLPIASSIPYAVTDSLGNLICSRNPDQTLLGYRQILTNQTTASGTLGDVTGLNFLCNCPTSRKIKVSALIPNAQNTVDTGGLFISINDVTAGAEIQEGTGFAAGANEGASVYAEAIYTPSAGGFRNFKLQFKILAGGTASTQGAATAPIWIKAELY